MKSHESAAASHMSQAFYTVGGFIYVLDLYLCLSPAESQEGQMGAAASNKPYLPLETLLVPTSGPLATYHMPQSCEN